MTGAARPVELGSVSRTMTILTREQIERLPVQSVADLLRLAASVDVRMRGVHGAQSDFAVRGANFGQVLVLVDGVRLNDAQSGHHNGDIPVPLDAVERIEVLYGPGSSLLGADAFGGTINVITRRAVESPSLVVQGGSFGIASGRGQAGFQRGAVRESLAVSADRSSGFMYDRDYRTTIIRSRTALGAATNISIAYLGKEFGANNFYGGNAPSREWTNQTLVAADHRFADVGGWSTVASASYRTHGDRFLFNQLQPQLSDNRHRTHAGLAGFSGARRVGDVGTLTAGIESGGDWIRSTNLGDHSTARVSGFGEWRQEIGTRTQVDGTLRVDRYSEFGTSWNPSGGIGWWAFSMLRLRASAGRAFRVPTFTERYYSDPANLAREEVGPETAWAGEGGADLLITGGWIVQATIFARADGDVIDWLRPTTADRWRTYNIRDVDTRGVELGVRKTFTGGPMILAEYTALDVDAAAVNQLSKYVLDYAPHSFIAAAAIPLPARFSVAPRVEYRRRSRTTGMFDYVLLDARIGKRLNQRFELYVDGSNLLDEKYQEIAGVAMPGATVAVSLAIKTR
ncbi:MAG TPA: TonB-dependent receptor [Vicinamibacterales bacterium]|nr:TonB-dependent receptor [Vicinamibacterales bacterium]